MVILQNSFILKIIKICFNTLNSINFSLTETTIKIYKYNVFYKMKGNQQRKLCRKCARVPESTRAEAEYRRGPHNGTVLRIESRHGQ